MIWLIGCNGMLGTEVSRQLKEIKISYIGSDREVDFTDENAVKNFASDKDNDFIINSQEYTSFYKADTYF